MPTDAVLRDARDRALLRRYHRHGDRAARDQMVVRAMPLVRSLARRYAERGEALEDLVQVGALGLVKAIDRFDPDAGTRFVSFAAPTITGEIRRHFRDHTWAVHVPRAVKELDAKVQHARVRLEETTGREPAAAEIAAHLGTTADEVRGGMLGGRAYRSHSLHHPLGEAGEVIDVHGELDQGYVQVERRALVEDAMRGLDPRARHVVRARYEEGRLQREIAADVGVSQMQVSRILSQALATMRDGLGDDASLAS
ncbi:SigB/SigF/SigG family RNA polymerase sigma factor [Patulibacter sp. SYSU D01012]|uniref:SigB/SigF/SigG family RNA polymerase sigma factor n=1 Tax=Patulibacter sp. SYSU D01012 TaxID=2817381 RepID=UPI001B30FC5F